MQTFVQHKISPETTTASATTLIDSSAQNAALQRKADLMEENPIQGKSIQSEADSEELEEENA